MMTIYVFGIFSQVIVSSYLIINLFLIEQMTRIVASNRTAKRRYSMPPVDTGRRSSWRMRSMAGWRSTDASNRTTVTWVVLLTSSNWSMCDVPVGEVVSWPSLTPYSPKRSHARRIWSPIWKSDTTAYPVPTCWATLSNYNKSAVYYFLIWPTILHRFNGIKRVSL